MPSKITGTGCPLQPVSASSASAAASAARVVTVTGTSFGARIVGIAPRSTTNRLLGGEQHAGRELPGRVERALHRAHGGQALLAVQVAQQRLLDRVAP